MAPHIFFFKNDQGETRTAEKFDKALLLQADGWEPTTHDEYINARRSQDLGVEYTPLPPSGGNEREVGGSSAGLEHPWLYDHEGNYIG